MSASSSVVEVGRLSANAKMPSILSFFQFNLPICDKKRRFARIAKIAKKKEAVLYLKLNKSFLKRVNCDKS